MPKSARVLLVEANFAVGMAVDRRLRGLATVEHTDGVALAGGLCDVRIFDVVLLCPYLAADLRERLLARLRRRSPPPTLMAIGDAVQRVDIALLDPVAATPPAVGSLIRALTAPA